MSSIGLKKDAFDRVVVINLARRTERLARFNNLFAEWPLKKPQRFEALDGYQARQPRTWKVGPGAWGCMLSHRAVLQAAINDNVSSLFVLEDDAIPAPDFAARAATFLNRVPPDWDCLMFGGEHVRPPIPITPGIVQCAGTTRTHAFAIRGAMMPMLLAYWLCYETTHCDIILASLMPQFRVYAPDSFLIGQDAGHSDISEHAEELRFWSKEQNPGSTELERHRSPFCANPTHRPGQSERVTRACATPDSDALSITTNIPIHA